MHTGDKVYSRHDRFLSMIWSEDSILALFKSRTCISVRGSALIIIGCSSNEVEVEYP